MQFHPNIWYLVKTKPRMEQTAEMNLKNQSVEYFLPKFTCGKREGKVIFPGYIFIKPKTGYTFQSIRSTRGGEWFCSLWYGFRQCKRWDDWWSERDGRCDEWSNGSDQPLPKRRRGLHQIRPLQGFQWGIWEVWSWSVSNCSYKFLKASTAGHSFGVGAALDLLDKNIPLEKIMLRGGWLSETSAMRYLQSWSDQNWTVVYVTSSVSEKLF